MSDVVLKNRNIEIGINYHGAELKSLRRIDTDTEYLWCGDPAFWNRSSPVLFPFVGGVKNGVYRHQGKEYAIGQHGFARDREFSLISKTEDTVWFRLTDDETSREIYPFPFCLEIGYQLLEQGVRVMWRVENTGNETQYFAIGAHPAFNCPIHRNEKQTDCKLQFRNANGENLSRLKNRIFGQGGTVTDSYDVIELENGILPITETLFDHDAKVIEDHQVERISLLDGEDREYLAVEFASPLVGVWSPPKKHAPFVCIEPWYGRCDRVGFNQKLEEREYGNALSITDIFQVSFDIQVF